MKKWLALALVLGALTTVSAPALAGAMTIADVVRLAKGGAGDDVIMSQIEASNEVFTLTVQDILDLKQSGVSDRVITYMINTGKARGDDAPPAGSPASEVSRETESPGIAGIDTRRYERLPAGDPDETDEAEDGYEDLNARYQVGVAAGYDWSPYWNISLGWGYGGYYDPWYCGYWPSYWDYYAPFRCWSSYWWCPPRYYGWWDYGYPVYYGNNHHGGNHDGWTTRRDRTLKDGRTVYGRGGQGAGSADGNGANVSAGYGRNYKQRPANPAVGTQDRAVYRNRQVNYGGRTGRGPQYDQRPGSPPIGAQSPSAPQPGRSVKRERQYRQPDVRPPVAPVPAQPTPEIAPAPSQPQPSAPAPSYGGRGGPQRGSVAPPRGKSPPVAPAPAQKGGTTQSGRSSKKS